EFLASRRDAGALNPAAAQAGQDNAQGPCQSASLPQAVVAEKNTNSLLVRGTPREMAEIQKLILDLDSAPQQVVIQALLIEVELGNTNEFGLEVGVQDSVLFNRSVIDKVLTVTQTNTTPGGNQTTNQNIISQTANPGFNFNN